MSPIKNRLPFDERCSSVEGHHFCNLQKGHGGLHQCGALIHGKACLFQWTYEKRYGLNGPGKPTEETIR
jgi:hypothetical protein